MCYPLFKKVPSSTKTFVPTLYDVDTDGVVCFVSTQHVMYPLPGTAISSDDQLPIGFQLAVRIVGKPLEPVRAFPMGNASAIGDLRDQAQNIRSMAHI